MRTALHVGFLCLALWLPSISLKAQQPPPPKTDQNNNPVSTVRNDANSALTIETRVSGQWQALKIDAGKDATIPGDHIRVATTRPDGAVISIDVPVKAGEEYRIFWNVQASMWDIALAH